MGKMVMKQCPQCEQQVPVACKTCGKCGHVYFQARRPVQGNRSQDSDSGALSAVKRRRGEQLRQLKNANKDINYGNLNRPKEQRISRSKSRTNSTCNSTEDGEGAVEETLKKKRGRQRRNPSPEREAVNEKDIHSQISPEKAAKYAIILSEINRKMSVPNFNV